MAMKLSGLTPSVTFLTTALLSAPLLLGCGAGNASPPPSGGGNGGSGNPGGGAMNGAGGNNNPGGGSPTGGANPGNGGAQPGGGTGSGGDIGPGGSGAGGSGPKVFEAGTDPNRNNVPPGQVCDRIATIQCAGEAFCCDAPGRSFDQCKATMRQGCIDQLYLDAITSNAITGYDSGNASGIFTEYENRASQCDTGVTAWGASTLGLRGLAPGTRSSGQSCQPPLAQLTDKPVAAAFLASCTNPDSSACYPTALTWICSPRAALGGKCFADTNCNDGLYCDNTSLAITGGHCQNRKADGTGCASLNECQSLLCKGGSCVPPTQQNAYCLSQ